MISRYRPAKAQDGRLKAMHILVLFSGRTVVGVNVEVVIRYDSDSDLPAWAAFGLQNASLLDSCNCDALLLQR